MLIELRKVLKTSPKNNSETNEEEIFMPSELIHKIINNLRLK